MFKFPQTNESDLIAKYRPREPNELGIYEEVGGGGGEGGQYQVNFTLPTKLESHKPSNEDLVVKKIKISTLGFVLVDLKNAFGKQSWSPAYTYIYCNSHCLIFR